MTKHGTWGERLRRRRQPSPRVQHRTTSGPGTGPGTRWQMGLGTTCNQSRDNDRKRGTRGGKLQRCRQPSPQSATVHHQWPGNVTGDQMAEGTGNCLHPEPGLTWTIQEPAETHMADGMETRWPTGLGTRWAMGLGTGPGNTAPGARTARELAETQTADGFGNQTANGTRHPLQTGPGPHGNRLRPRRPTDPGIRRLKGEQPAGWWAGHQTVNRRDTRQPMGWGTSPGTRWATGPGTSCSRGRDCTDISRDPGRATGLRPLARLGRRCKVTPLTIFADEALDREQMMDGSHVQEQPPDGLRGWDRVLDGSRCSGRPPDGWWAQKRDREWLADGSQVLVRLPERRRVCERDRDQEQLGDRSRVWWWPLDGRRVQERDWDRMADESSARWRPPDGWRIQERDRERLSDRSHDCRRPSDGLRVLEFPADGSRTAGEAGAGWGPGDCRERCRSAEREEDATDREDVERAAAARIANTEDRIDIGTTGGVMRGSCDAEDGPGHGEELPEAR